MAAVAKKAESVGTQDREVVVERVYDAPRELVWTAWTDPKHVDRWWGPNGFRNETHSMDLRPGGTWKYVMHGPDGKDWGNWIRYEEVVPAERLVYEHGGDDGPVAHFHVTITFKSEGKRTRVTMHSVFPTAAALAAVKKFGAIEGGRQNLARLSGYLPHLADGSAEGAMVVSRLMDAPAALVFQAWSTVQGLERWWGPKGFTTKVPELDFRVGGKYRMVMRDAAGTDYPFQGTFREIVQDRRIVFGADVAHGAESFFVSTTVTFAEENGKTLLTVRQDRPSAEGPARGQLQGWSRPGEAGRGARALTSRCALHLALLPPGSHAGAARGGDRAPPARPLAGWTRGDGGGGGAHPHLPRRTPGAVREAPRPPRRRRPQGQVPAALVRRRDGRPRALRDDREARPPPRGCA